MKKMLTAKELISYLDKKTAELEGTIMIKELFPIESSKIDKKSFELGFQIGKLQGQRDVLLELALLLKMF
jgi:hypothetical protein